MHINKKLGTILILTLLLSATLTTTTVFAQVPQEEEHPEDPGPIPDSSAAISISPEEGRAGTQVTITGSNYDSDGPVELSFGRDITQDRSKRAVFHIF